MSEWVLAPEDWRQSILEASLYRVERELQELIAEQIEEAEFYAEAP